MVRGPSRPVIEQTPELVEATIPVEPLHVVAGALVRGLQFTPGAATRDDPSDSTRTTGGGMRNCVVDVVLRRSGLQRVLTS